MNMFTHVALYLEFERSPQSSEFSR